jgi:hypothetical protein
LSVHTLPLSVLAAGYDSSLLAHAEAHEVKGSADPKAALCRGAKRNPLTVWQNGK